MKHQLYAKRRRSLLERIAHVFRVFRLSAMTKGPYIVHKGKEPAKPFALE
jgi:hypothetical protein